MAAAGDPLIVGPVKSNGTRKLLLLAPTGLMGAKSYLPMIQSIQSNSELRLFAAVVQCRFICHDTQEMSMMLQHAINKANESSGGGLMLSDVFVAGHGLGGVVAHHFFNFHSGMAGLILFGTQYMGDRYSAGGYPTDLKTFPGALLALSGELDMVPISHIAKLVDIAKSIDNSSRLSKLPIIIAGMDQSQFCAPPYIKGDIKPEISDVAATRVIGEATSSWLDYVTLRSMAAASLLERLVTSTEDLAAPFITAAEADKSLCASSQTHILQNATSRFNVSIENHVELEDFAYCHTAHKEHLSEIQLKVCSYRRHVSSYTTATLPGLLPVYASPEDITCKMSSEEMLASLLKIPAPDMRSAFVMNKCKLLNEGIFVHAKQIISATNARAIERFENQGKLIVFDSDTHAASPFEFLFTGLSIEENVSAFKIQSRAGIITPLSSPVFPGNHYCHLLAPSRAVEIILTMALTERYSWEPPSMPVIIV